MVAIFVRHALVLALILASLSPWQSARAQPGDAVTRADAALAAYTAEQPGLAVIVATGDRILYERYSGLADLEQGTPVTSASRFHIGSTSKQFYAFAALQLEKSGKLDLDADIHRYLPELKPYDAKVTTRQLIYHTSGIRDIWELMILSGRPLDDAFTQQAAVAMLANQRGLTFEPGSDFRYSNGGYILLAEIVARASGMSTRQSLASQIFTPLGMKDTLAFDDGTEIIRGRVQSYMPGPEKSTKFARMNFTTLGPAGVIATARDLLVWTRALTGKTVLDPGLVAAAKAPGALADGTRLTYAAGLVLGDLAGHPAIYHAGAEGGYRSLIATFPKQDVQIIVLSSGSVEGVPLATQLAEIFLPPAPAAKAAAAGRLPDASQQAAVVGYYTNGWDAGIDLIMKDGKLSVSRGSASIPVTFIDEKRFYVVLPANLFEIGADGSLNGTSGLSGTLVQYKRAVRAPQAEVDFAAAGGRYFSDELDITYNLSAKSDHLLLETLRAQPAKLYPVDVDSFETIDARYPSIRITLQRDKARQIVGFNVATGRLRGLLFRRM